MAGDLGLVGAPGEPTLGGLEPSGPCGDVAGTVLEILIIVLVTSVPAFISD